MDNKTQTDQSFPMVNTVHVRLCEEFISITNTNKDLAMKILQQNEWNLQQALNTYLNEQQTESSLVYQNLQLPNEKRDFKLLSWNIDGLDTYGLELRTQGVINVIKKELPDAVFLQEVIPDALYMLQTSLPEYTVYAGNFESYFVVVLIYNETMTSHNFELIPYSSTRMGRNLLIIHTTYKNSIDIDLMTTHHESGTEELSSNERMEQLKICFKRMIDAPKHRIVLFGGDLNMRQKELYKVGNIPPGIYDLWLANGKPSNCEYTWDMNLNTNKNFPSVSRPRARFDRLYFRPSNDNDKKFQPFNFELKGLDIIPSIQRFCSDHWAIQVSFNV